MVMEATGEDTRRNVLKTTGDGDDVFAYNARADTAFVKNELHAILDALGVGYGDEAKDDLRLLIRQEVGLQDSWKTFREGELHDIGMAIVRRDSE